MSQSEQHRRDAQELFSVTQSLMCFPCFHKEIERSQCSRDLRKSTDLSLAACNSVAAVCDISK